MATAEELLAASATEQSDDTLVIDSELRTITIPAGYEILGVESDDDVNRVQFSGPRYYHDADLSTFEIRVNITNANGDLDIFPVMDMNVEDGSDTITFSWLVGRYTAQYKGDVTFSLCFREVNSEGAITREFNTTTATGKILEGLEVGELIIQQNPDVLERILLRLDSKANIDDVEALPIKIADDGYTDINGIRQLTNLSVIKEDNVITLNYTLQGGKQYSDVIELDTEGLPTKITTSHASFDVVWEGF